MLSELLPRLCRHCPMGLEAPGWWPPVRSADPLARSPTIRATGARSSPAPTRSRCAASGRAALTRRLPSVRMLRVSLYPLGFNENTPGQPGLRMRDESFACVPAHGCETFERMRWAFLAVAVGACGGDGQHYTKGDYCDATGTAVCMRAQACGIDGTFNACFQGFKGACCINNGTCGLELGGAGMDREARCVPAVGTQACGELTAGVVPAVCLMGS